MSFLVASKCKHDKWMFMKHSHNQHSDQQRREHGEKKNKTLDKQELPSERSYISSEEFLPFLPAPFVIL